MTMKSKRGSFSTQKYKIKYLKRIKKEMKLKIQTKNRKTNYNCKTLMD
jgi:hypothetical protein